MKLYCSLIRPQGPSLQKGLVKDQRRIAINKCNNLIMIKVQRDVELIF